jgi:4-hydroxybenzoate polyprenyltransferase
MRAASSRCTSSAARRGLGQAYWIALGVAALLVVYEFVIARHRERDQCFRAFLHNQWVGATVFAGIAVALWQKAH